MKHPLITELERKKSTGSRLQTVTRILGAAALLAVLVSVLNPPRVVLATTYGWGYAWADRPLAKDYSPSPRYSYNSTGAAVNIRRLGVGGYMITFPNPDITPGSSEEIASVTAYGQGTATCLVSRPVEEDVDVQCFALSGTPVDTPFTITYANPVSTPHPMAFIWADQPSPTQYTPDPDHQLNSTGALNTITHTGTGAYTVRLPGLGAAAGHVQVTGDYWGSQGDLAKVRCKVAGWGPSGADQLVRVRCFTNAGLPTDARFSMTYIKDTSLVGSDCCGTGAGTVSAYAGPTSPARHSTPPVCPTSSIRAGRPIPFVAWVSGGMP